MYAKLSKRATLTLVVVMAACAERAPNPTSPQPPGAAHRRAVATATWPITDMQAEYGDLFSWDTTTTGLNTAVQYDDYPGTDGEFCRDHFNAIDLWWNGGDGIATIHLDPPLLFVGYRSTGAFKDRRGLFWRRAVYETVQGGEGVDPAGNVWRFQGKFNALCRGGSREIGPIVFSSQLVVAQDPIDRPVLVRRGSSSGGAAGGCEAMEDEMYQPGYSPYQSETTPTPCGSGSGGSGSPDGDSAGSGYQFEPGDLTGGETVDWSTGKGNGGSSVCGDKATVDYVCIDVYNEDSQQWEQWSCGYVTTC